MMETHGQWEGTTWLTATQRRTSALAEGTVPPGFDSRCLLEKAKLWEQAPEQWLPGAVGQGRKSTPKECSGLWERILAVVLSTHLHTLLKVTPKH